MKKSMSALGLLLASALVSGCQTGPQGSGVQQGVSVTRFHLGQPIARGEIRVEPSDPAAASSLEFSQQAAAVGRELSRLGWTVMPENARSEQVAVVSIVYDHHARELASKLIDKAHHHHDLVVSSMHVHLGERHCLEVSILRGPGKKVRHLADDILATRGVLHGDVSFTGGEKAFRDLGTGHEHGHSHGH